MTDYEKDYNRWKNDQSFNGRYNPEPKRSDYDEYGFKPNTVIYEIINKNYLVEIQLISPQVFYSISTDIGQ